MSPKTERKKGDMEKIPYQEAFGSLFYLAMTTHPDIYSVCRGAGIIVLPELRQQH
jgi:hypothetical protein